MVDYYDARVDSGPPLTIWICIPELPPSLNVWSRQHWRHRHRKIKSLAEVLKMLALVYKIPRLAKAELQYVYYFQTRSRRDPDNYGFKQCTDALRHAGIIANDNSEVLRLPQPRFEVDKVAPRTEIFIREWQGR